MSETKQSPVKVSPVTAILNAVASGNMAKSEAIRQLRDLGVSRWDTSKVLGIKYQFVRNVLVRDAEVTAKRAAKASSETK